MCESFTVRRCHRESASEERVGEFVFPQPSWVSLIQAIWANLWCFDKPRHNDLHPTMKPIELIERAIMNSSRPGDIVLDVFGGSGSTLITCKKTNPPACLIQIHP